MHERTLIVYPDPRLLAQAVAARTLLTLNEVLGTPGRDRADIAVTGGTDGTAILESMASSALLDIVDWSRVHVWWGDERFVAADSDERNDRAARAALFDALIAEGRMGDAQIHAMPADDRSAEARSHATAHDDGEALEHAAARYQQELLYELGEAAAMDLMMFGVGPDGHFASLFPGRPQLGLDGDDVLVTGVQDSPKPPPLRLTMTVPMIARSARVWMCGSRPGKAEAMAHTFLQRRDTAFPGSFADATHEVLWICDEDSAAQIRQ
ncbi:6-phosphogluconolactonase [Bifidobacterium pseudolongum]|uniref:6-phosphogluconolactonase n=1 Tax=Bifidobacterium pseudolongum subsp. globosum TaxID=1690 RepID=A0A4Q5A689_9BIFI|nr:6-phosphogluconolactonase [Bifidobacterium pseudolongum]RYQ18630.1 6-phosphogluconolactonase [Bifidobacterium pseudolongum subsp. globosum]